MRQFNSLTLFGPPASGLERATTILQEPRYAGRIVVPQLVITQPFHPGADVFPNPIINLPEDEFLDEIEGGNIRPYWQRITDVGQPAERFGFQKQAVEDDRFPVYIANSYIARNENPTTEILMKSGLLVAFNASWAIRLARLNERLGSATRAEEFMRIQSKDLDLMPYGIATTMTIDTGIDINTGMPTEPDHGKNELRKILESLLDLRQE